MGINLEYWVKTTENFEVIIGKTHSIIGSYLTIVQRAYREQKGYASAK